MIPPSISRALGRAAQTAARFKIAIAAAIVGSIVMVLIIETSGDSPILTRGFLAAGLGLSLGTAEATCAERLRLDPRKRSVAALAIVGLLVVLFAVSRQWTTTTTFLRFTQAALVTHLLVAVGPFLVGGNRTGFWQFNRYLFIRYLLASFYAGVLFAGLAIALVAINKLLGIRVASAAYSHLATLLYFLFHPWFFLAGVPEDLDALDRSEDYPVGLKVFTQFVLLPLVVVYLGILTLYLGRILLIRTWPGGWIGYLVSSVSLAGVLALLLLHPLRERADSKWVNAYGRWFFAAILPSLAMLLIASGKRIAQYGVTEKRYFLVALALWLTGLALYYAVTGSRNIRLIPSSLAFVAAITWFGPWGAYSTSLRSQLGRLDARLAANGMGTVGATHAAAGAVSFADRRELSAVLDYLEDTRGAAAVAKALGVTEASLAWQRADTTVGSGQLAFRAMQRLGLRYASRWDPETSGSSTDRMVWVEQSVGRGPSAALDIRGFEALQVVVTGDSVIRLALPDSVTVRIRWHEPELEIAGAGRPTEVVELGTAIREADQGNGPRAGAVPQPFVIDRETESYRVRLVWTQLSARVRPDSVWVMNGTASLLLGRRAPKQP